MHSQETALGSQQLYSTINSTAQSACCVLWVCRQDWAEAEDTTHAGRYKAAATATLIRVTVLTLHHAMLKQLLSCTARHGSATTAKQMMPVGM
jgi:hypothetical protein